MPKRCEYCGRFVPGDAVISQINDDEQGYACKRCHEKARTTLHYKRWHRFEVDDIKYPVGGGQKC
jgi:SPX domain protein involved in polyphosphate accumulation